MTEMGFSNNCSNLTTYWDITNRKCVPCGRKTGHEVNPNCGRDDKGGIHMNRFTKCESNTFNDGSSDYCLSCSQCPIGFTLLRPCNFTSDTICQKIKKESTTAALSKSTSTHATFTTAAQTPTNKTTTILETYSPQKAALWAVPIIMIVSILLVAAVCASKMKKRRGLCASCLTYTPQGQLCVCNNAFYKGRTSIRNDGFSPISSSGTNIEELEDILNANILSAPLHTVLDDLDVLEELVILLDPDTQGIKSTKHLASHCSFPSTWITYTYSMKDSKSPLKAVLEGVTSKQPDWTVGHLVKLLRQMGRNDAITVLAKVRVGPNASFM